MMEIDGGTSRKMLSNFNLTRNGKNYNDKINENVLNCKSNRDYDQFVIDTPSKKRKPALHHQQSQPTNLEVRKKN